MGTMTVGVRVRCADADAELLDRLARDLREAVLGTDVDGVRTAVAGPAPAGARSGEVLAVGALMVTLAPTVVDSLMDVLSSWLSRQPIDVELEVDGRRFRGRVTRRQRDDLVAGFLRHLDRES